MESLTAVDHEGIKSIEHVQQQTELREWLRYHSSDETVKKYEQRNSDANLLHKLKWGLRDERRKRKELENSLLYAGVDTASCGELVDCGDSISECIEAVGKVSFRNEQELERLRDSVNYIEKRSLNNLSSELSPATVITEFRRRLIFHALMGSQDFHVKREHAANILDKHTTQDPRPKRKVNLKAKPKKHHFLRDSLDRLIDHDHELSGLSHSPGTLISGKSTKSNLDEGNGPSLLDSADDADKVIAQAQSAQLDDDDVEEFEYTGYEENDKTIRTMKKKERARMLKLKTTAFSVPQAFKPEWHAYDVMRERWKGGDVRPTMSRLHTDK